MKTPVKQIWTMSAFLVIAFAWDGCEGVAVSGSAYVPVYGDYGYVGPWAGDDVDVYGGYYAAPPYRRFEREHREDDHRRDDGDRRPKPAPTVRREAARPIPSIPNRERPKRKDDHEKH